MEYTYSTPYKVSFDSYKRQAILAAKELYYGKAVLEKLKRAQTQGEIQRIMIGARRGKNW